MIIGRLAVGYNKQTFERERFESAAKKPSNLTKVMSTHQIHMIALMIGSSPLSLSILLASSNLQVLNTNY